MSTITTRAGKGSPLTNNEVDANFTNLNADKAELSGAAFTGAITTTSTVDGRDVATDGSKLDGIEAGATADQTAAEIKTAYESNADTNAFTDADESKLDGIEAGADVTDTTNVTAAGALMDSELTSIASVKALNQGVANTDSPTFAGLTTSADVSFGDNDKAIFGAGSDLQIYHDGSNSYISEVGTGELVIQARDAVTIEDGTSGDNYMYMQRGNKVSLFYAGAEKLATTSTGIDVTGTATMDGLTVEGANGNLVLGTSGNDITFNRNADNYITASGGTSSNIVINPQNRFVVNTNNTERMRIDSSGNVTIGSAALSATVGLKFQADTGTFTLAHDRDSHALVLSDSDGTGEVLRVDTSGNLLVGKSSADNTTAGTRIHPLGYASFTIANDYPIIANRLNSDGDIAVFRKDGTTVGSIGTANGDLYLDSTGGELSIRINGTTLYEFDSNLFYPKVDNSKDLGHSGGRWKDLYLSGTANVGGLDTTLSTNARGSFSSSIGEVGSGNFALQVTNSAGSALKPLGFRAEDIRFATGSSERMRIDSAGNLLVGNTVANPASGFSNQKGFGYAFSTGKVEIATTANDAVMEIGKNHADDGKILVFRKQGTEVGSIGTEGGRLQIGKGASGIYFYDSGPSVLPWNIGNNTGANNSIDLGSSGARFKDLYLSGGVYLGGTGAANKLDDYEEGTFTPTVIGSTTAGTATYSHQKGLYTKIGNVVTVQIYLNWTGGTGAGVLRFSSLPFTLYSASGFYASPAIGEYSSIAGTAGHTLCGIGLPNTVDIQFAENDFNSAPTTTTYDAAGYVILSMTYITA